MEDSLVESGHLPFGIGVIGRYQVLVSGGWRERSFIIEQVNERVLWENVVFLDSPKASEWVRTGGRKEGNDARLKRPGEHGRLG